MGKLKEEELKEIDNIIDSGIESQFLLKQTRDLALIHVLRIFEDRVRFLIVSGQNQNEKSSKIKNLQDGLHFAIQWIFQYCPVPSSNSDFDTQEKLYRQADELFDAAMDYSHVWDLMTLLFSKRIIGERDPEGVIITHYPEDIVDEIEIAARILSDPNSPDQRQQLIASSPPFNLNELIKELKPRYGGGKLRYSIPNSTYDKIYSFQKTNVNNLWELDNTWNLGGFTVADFRRFWITLVTLCWIHHWACMSSTKDTGYALNTVIQIRQRKRWENELARFSGLARNIISIILDDLIYDYSLYQANGKKPDVTYQPFFPINSELLALSNWNVLLSNAERNMWDLLSIKRQNIHSRLRNKKEELWLVELKEKLNKYGLTTFGPKNFTYNEESSNLDLLVLDNVGKFGIGFELKWLTTPDRVRDIKHTDKAIEDGQKQASLLSNWLNTNPAGLQDLTGISLNELREYQFEVMILSKNTIGSASINESDVPTINERLLHWTLGEPHRKNLQALWQVGKKRLYLPKRNTHFVDEDVTVEFSGVKFVGKKLGTKIKKSWRPDKDIDFSQIS